MRSTARATEKGFGTAVALSMFSFGVLALGIVAHSAAVTYADSVDRKAERVQREFDTDACADILRLIQAKDAFADGIIEVPEFGCVFDL